MLDASLSTAQAGVLAGPVILQVESVVQAPSAASGGCVGAARTQLALVCRPVCAAPTRTHRAAATGHTNRCSLPAPRARAIAACGACSSCSNVAVRLTDGHVTLTGVEHEAFTDGAGVSLRTPPGAKVGLVAVPVHAGRLLLTPDNCTVLGACVRSGVGAVADRS